MEYQIVLINRPVDTSRKERMLERLAKHNLVKNLHIISADDDTSEFRAFVKGVEDRFDFRQLRVAGSLFCHLQAYRYFLEESNCSECIIMEDDAMLHNDFRNKLASMVDNKPIERDCILLAPYTTHLLEYDQQVFPGLYNHYSGGIFGASCYWFTKDFARNVLERYGRPMREYLDFSPCITSENVIHNLGAYITMPALAIEESLDSNLQPQSHLPRKKSYWSYYGFENFG
jgi:GR25 family glycosyltransferase involved in LPS biosynthesis